MVVSKSFGHLKNKMFITDHMIWTVTSTLSLFDPKRRLYARINVFCVPISISRNVKTLGWCMMGVAHPDEKNDHPPIIGIHPLGVACGVPSGNTRTFLHLSPLFSILIPDLPGHHKFSEVCGPRNIPDKKWCPWRPEVCSWLGRRTPRRYFVK